MARARAIPALSSDEPMAIGAARILAVRTEELRDHSRDVLDITDIERVHDMRVATRRLRAALEVFEACFPAKLHAQALREVKDLADALGERRDRDVAIETLSGFAAKLAAPDRRGVESLIETLRLEQADANEHLRPFVAEERVAGLCERLRELVAEARHGVEPPPPDARTLAHSSAGNGSGALA